MEALKGFFADPDRLPSMFNSERPLAQALALEGWVQLDGVPAVIEMGRVLSREACHKIATSGDPDAIATAVNTAAFLDAGTRSLVMRELFSFEAIDTVVEKGSRHDIGRMANALGFLPEQCAPEQGLPRWQAVHRLLNHHPRVVEMVGKGVAGPEGGADLQANLLNLARVLHGASHLRLLGDEVRMRLMTQLLTEENRQLLELYRGPGAATVRGMIQERMAIPDQPSPGSAAAASAPAKRIYWPPAGFLERPANAAGGPAARPVLTHYAQLSAGIPVVQGGWEAELRALTVPGDAPDLAALRAFFEPAGRVEAIARSGQPGLLGQACRGLTALAVDSARRREMTNDWGDVVGSNAAAMDWSLRRGQLSLFFTPEACAAVVGSQDDQAMEAFVDAAHALHPKAHSAGLLELVEWGARQLFAEPANADQRDKLTMLMEALPEDVREDGARLAGWAPGDAQQNAGAPWRQLLDASAQPAPATAPAAMPPSGREGLAPR